MRNFLPAVLAFLDEENQLDTSLTWIFEDCTKQEEIENFRPPTQGWKADFYEDCNSVRNLNKLIKALLNEK